MKSHQIKTSLSKKRLHGFTLVELIVVITILVILGTIAFTSLSGYSGSARDSSRISDLTNISKALDISYQKTNSYPSPDNSFAVTYSGGNVWYQGTVGDTVMTTLNAAGGIKLSKKPTDPLKNTTEYTYSKLAYGNAYQVKTDWEGDTVQNNKFNPFNEANAATGNPTITYIKGNYNGAVAKTQTGTTTYILAVPSIISSTGAISGVIRIDNNELSGALLMNGQNKTGIVFNPNKVVYAGAALPTTTAEKILFASGVANAYSGTVIATTASIQPFIVAIASNNTGSLATLGGGISAASLGGSPTSTPSGGGGGGGSNSCATNPVFANLGTLTTGTPLSAGQAWTYSASPGNCTYTCINSYTGNGCATAPVLANIDGSSTTYIVDSANGSSRFTLSATNTIVTDAVTGLKWQSYYNASSADYISGYNASFDWAGAKTYCAGLTIGGLAGWRLPDSTELLSIVDFSKSTGLAIDTNFFGSQNNYYLSSTADPYYPATNSLVVYFSVDSGISSLYTTATGPVRCVR